MPMSISLTFARLVSALAATAITSGPLVPPAAKMVPFVRSYYGTPRSDPYHWMESGGPDLAMYLRSQSAYTQALLAANPGRSRAVRALRNAYEQSSRATTTSGVTRNGSKLYYLQSLAGSSSPSLLVHADGKNPHVVVDAKSLPVGSVITWFEPSPRGTKVAYGVTASSESVEVHVRNADGSSDRRESITPSVIADVTWYDDRSFYYSNVRETASNRTEASFIHVLGARRGGDTAISGFDVTGPMGSHSRDIFTTYAVIARDAVAAMPMHDVTPHTPVFVAPYARARSAAGPWRELFGESDLVVDVAFSGRYAFALSDSGDRHRIVIVRDRLSGAFVRSIAANDGFRSRIFGNRTGVYVVERVGAKIRLERFDRSGAPLHPIALPDANAVTAIVGKPDGTTFAIETSTWRDPAHWYEVRGDAATIRDAAVDAPTPNLYAHVLSEDALATSADGTRVPYTVIFANGTLRDGRRPTVVVGYGAYGYDLEPPMPTYVAALLDLGVVVVVAHVRGGGEFGEMWHLAGKGAAKQHTIDDFVACALAAQRDGWTSSDKIAGWGASAGGITIGGAITQHPGLFAVAVSQVGFNDMIDYENMPNGPTNVPEFGSVETAIGFRILLAMSAYDHVAPAMYPATILTTGLNDKRDSPWQVAKLAARLQAATTSGKPVLLRADAQGHGVVLDASANIAEYADLWTFVLWQLHEPGFHP